MSECVVRMEMPNGCHDCKLRNMIGNCPIPMFDGPDEKKIWTLAECFQRPPWCPIICQLPEGHGRLVDKDEAIESIRTEVTELFFNGLKGTPRPDGDLRFMWNRLEDEDFAPTIVPRKKGAKNER